MQHLYKNHLLCEYDPINYIALKKNKLLSHPNKISKSLIQE